jgi:GAF domain-containing protein
VAVGTGGQEAWLAQLGRRFEELGTLLASTRSGPVDPDRLVDFAARALPHLGQCGLTLVRTYGRPATVAATHPLVRQIDLIQCETGQGPCLGAAEGHDVRLVADLAADPQWPEFGRRCVAEAGVRSMVSVRLVLSGSERAALSFYAGPPDTFDESDVGVGVMFAPFAALATEHALQHEQIGNLRAALASSRQIGTAVGILMARHLVTSEQAFAQLVKASQHLNRKLRDIAAEVAVTGMLPELPVTRPGPVPGPVPRPGPPGGSR